MNKSSIMEINITGLTSDIIIGTRDHELEVKQKIIIDINLTYDASPAIISDKEEDVVDYWKISSNVLSRLNQSKYSLVESLINDITNFLLKDSRIISCKVTLHKPKALEEFGALVTVSSCN